MRTKMIALLIALMMLLAFPAGAVTITNQTEQGTGGTITYIVATDENIDAFLQARLDMDDALILLRSGAEITGTGDVYTFEKDGVSYASLRFTQQGKIRFGRYGQVVSTVLLDLTEGSEVNISAVTGDMDALQSALDLYVEEKVLPHINTYLDASELLPVPLDNVYFAKDGLTIHYPADRFSFFSGNSGAVEIKYYELADMLADMDAQITPDTAQQVFALAAQGALPGVSDVWLDMTLSGALAMHGTLTDPDYIADGEIYEVEEPALRGVQLIVPRDAQEGEKLQGIRSMRVNMFGLKTGVTMRDECIQILGKAAASVNLDASAAESYRMAEGTVDIYSAGAYTLKMYYDMNDVLFAAEVSR